MLKRGMTRKGILVISIIVTLIIAIYFTFFFYYKCEDLACFKAHQEKCSKTKFVNDLEDATWFYQIKGKSDGECEIYVKLLSVKKGKINLQKLEGKSMVCYLPLGSSVSPESDISRCHGLLKESLQEIIINNLHSYIVSNIGEIGKELEKVI